RPLVALGGPGGEISQRIGTRGDGRAEQLGHGSFLPVRANRPLGPGTRRRPFVLGLRLSAAFDYSQHGYKPLFGDASRSTGKSHPKAWRIQQGHARLPSATTLEQKPWSLMGYLRLGHAHPPIRRGV